MDTTTSTAPMQVKAEIAFSPDPQLLQNQAGNVNESAMSDAQLLLKQETYSSRPAALAKISAGRLDEWRKMVRDAIATSTSLPKPLQGKDKKKRDARKTRAAEYAHLSSNLKEIPGIESLNEHVIDTAIIQAEADYAASRVNDDYRYHLPPGRFFAQRHFKRLLKDPDFEPKLRHLLQTHLAQMGDSQHQIREQATRQLRAQRKEAKKAELDLVGIMKSFDRVGITGPKPSAGAPKAGERLQKKMNAKRERKERAKEAKRAFAKSGSELPPLPKLEDDRKAVPGRKAGMGMQLDGPLKSASPSKAQRAKMRQRERKHLQQARREGGVEASGMEGPNLANEGPAPAQMSVDT
ncbi:hypothetical protein MMC25_003993 [Agyrium rufum]|nr:hypothetical protein [Agyrium rufum]